MRQVCFISNKCTLWFVRESMRYVFFQKYSSVTLMFTFQSIQTLSVRLDITDSWQQNPFKVAAKKSCSSVNYACQGSSQWSSSACSSSGSKHKEVMRLRRRGKNVRCFDVKRARETVRGKTKGQERTKKSAYLSRKPTNLCSCCVVSAAGPSAEFCL